MHSDALYWALVRGEDRVKPTGCKCMKVSKTQMLDTLSKRISDLSLGKGCFQSDPYSFPLHPGLFLSRAGEESSQCPFLAMQYRCSQDW